MGEKCAPYGNDGNTWNATKCVPVAPNAGGVGEPCTVEGNGLSGLDTCEVAALCWDVDPQTNEGTCRSLCTGTPEQPECPAASTCVITGDGILNLCLPWCDPLAQDCPLSDYACLNYQSEFFCVPDASGDMGVYGDVCEFGNACDPGLFCADAGFVPGCGGLSCCTPYCDTAQPNTCPGDGQECVPWFDEGEAPDGYENVGGCKIPL
ncbi:MAG: ribulose phosphate epimerase [Nannocystaceae bacterium]